ncbi:hormogonium polysaccharide biosynthesis protein HpsA [Coleofasciculus chthonoplastes]|uniref:hormogonium polysaccharide biosynthesis protein HpsA n=1 Tax=Coleofasciculus chthonoplastes TaxID=64178 RepID=UPI003302E1D2
MSIPKKLINLLQRLCHQTAKLIRSTNKRVMSWLLRRLIMMRHQLRPANSGFVLPTVVMVIIVVTLLSTAIVFRSFDRAKNAQNVRVNERVLAAAGPAIDRAQAKIQALLADPTLPRGTPTDQALYQAMTGSLNQYTLGDETPLRLVQEFNGQPNIQESLTTELNNLESLDTAWRFPVDTDNNGKFDSYTLYGLYFRNPTPGTERDRSPLEARSTPMDNATAGNACGTGTSASLVGNTGWYKTSDGNLKKSFFVFAATVPIEEPPGNDYEKYKGNQGFAALEYQQDRARIPLTNNAVVYQDDLEITPGAGIFLNGRIMTNGNFFVGQRSNDVRFFQVSSINSCFYNEDNGKITVGGNLKVGSVNPTGASGAVTVDLFKVGAAPTNGMGNLSDTESSVSGTAPKTSYNSKAYAARIDDLVTKAVAQNKIPDEVTQKISLNPSLTQQEALQAYFEQRTRQVPFAEVPDTNPDPLTGAGLQGTVAANDIRPPDNWIYPANLTTGASNTGLTLNKAQPPATDPALRGADEDRLGDRIQVGNGLPAQWWDPDTQQFVDFYDQVPQPVDGSTSQSTTWTGSSDYRTRMTQVIPLSDLGDTERDGFWEQKAAEAPVQPLDGVGGLRVVTGAGIYVPDAIATPPTPASFLPRPSSPVADDLSTWQDESGFRVVLPDSMPMWDDTNNNGTPDATDERGDLLMRATAVYHYRDDDGDNQGDYQEPIACVSSYYDPSTPTTAINRVGLPNISLRNRPPEPPRPFPINNVVAGGLSNNGVSYPPPTTASSLSFGQSIPGYPGGGAGAGVFPTPNPPGTGSLGTQLAYQANLVFPNGRLVNQPLHDALVKKKNENANNTLTLAEQGAIDSAICALQIWDGTLTPSDAVIPHGTIYETTFLDAKQVKGIESESPASGPTADYDLALEERQPLEIRATVLDLDLLRRREITGTNTTVPAPEYLLPDSGIIYATRDDALPDLSTPTNATGQPNVNQAAERISTRKINSPVDFILDPTRRPNGIMLINGSTLARGNAGNDWKQEEKGLILASNLPVYVKANELAVNADAFGFNLHRISRTTTTQLEEFKYKLSDRNWNENDFYINREEDGANGRDPNFACRKDQPGLPGCDPGDYWRPATVLADSVTLLSNNFRFGFRNEGDYDLRKNVENLDNDLVTSGYDFTGEGTLDTTTVSINEQNVGLDLDGNGTPGENVAVDFQENQIPVTLARRLNGFFDNNYLTSADWLQPGLAAPDAYPKDFDSTIAGNQGSSYVNNFVTPIQRRRNSTNINANFPEYVMEICLEPLVSDCTPGDWVVGTTADSTLKAREIDTGTDLVSNLRAGTTARFPVDPADRRYPRRIAFLRDAQNRLVLNPNNNTPVVLGIDGSNVNYYSYSSSFNVNGQTTVAGVPPSVPNALWFRTTTTSADPTTNPSYYGQNPLFYQTPLAVTTPGVGTTQQPLLVPVLQIQTLDDDVPTDNNLTPLGDTEWMQKPPTNTATTFNLIIVGGDTPTRDSGFAGAPVAEFNGGMPNFPIFLENWDRGGGSNAVTTSINGSFIQFKRSAYATAPFLSVLTPNLIESSPSDLFNYTIGKVSGTKSPYKTSNSSGRTAFYGAPDRKWGYDVGLLSQLPDLFSQQITSPSGGEPNEYYRELSRDDDWVQTLLCAQAADRDSWDESGSEYDYDTNAVDDDQRRHCS